MELFSTTKMDNEQEDGSVCLSKGINFQELISKNGTQFHIDLNFKNKKQNPIFDDNDQLVEDDDENDGDPGELLKNIENTTERMMLASPEYHSFDELASKMTDCVSSGDVKILIIEEGEGDLVPSDGVVLVHYAAYWEREKIPFDTTLVTGLGAPRKMRLGFGNILPGLEIGLTMVKGPRARFQLLLTPAVTWGDLGVLKRIKNERSLFCVTLLQVEDIGAVERFNNLPSDDQKKFAVTLKTVNASNFDAKECFKKGQYKQAVYKYYKSLSVLQICVPEHDGQMDEIKKLLSNVYCNLAVCYIKLNLPKRVLLMCDDLARTIDLDAHCKGLYCYGRAFSMLGQHEEAMNFYKRAMKLEPKNTEIGTAMADLNRTMELSAERERNMWKSAFKAEKEDADEGFNVDDDIKAVLKEICDDLKDRPGVVKINLPSGWSKSEREYARRFVNKIPLMEFVEDEMAGEKLISIVKKMN